MDNERSNGHENGRPRYRQFSKRPVRPDFTARDEQLKVLQAKVKDFSDLAKAKTSELEALQNENKASSKLESLKRSLANAQHNRVQAQKLHDMTKKRLDEVNNPKTAKLPKTKGVDLNLSPQDILARMEQLKDKVSNEPDPEESSRLIARIQALNASYVQLMGVDAASGPDGANGAAAGGASVKERLEADLARYAEDLRSAEASEIELREQLTDLRGKLETAQPHIDQLRKERETCQDVVRTLRDKITAINEEWQAKFDEFKAATDRWFIEKEEVMKERDAQRAQEQKERAEERARREKEAKGPPFMQQIYACEQLLGWCKKHEKAASAKEAGASSGQGAAAPAAFDGMVAMSKKGDDDGGDMLTTSRTKSKKKAPRSARVPTDESARKASGKINHDMDTLALCAKLKVPVPKDLSDVETLAQTVEAKKAEFEEKQRKALAGEGPEEDEVDESDAAASTSGGGAAVAAGGAASSRGDGSSGARGAGDVNGMHAPVRVSMRCDEAFGSVLVELAAH